MRLSFPWSSLAGTIALALATTLATVPAQALPAKLPPIEQCKGDAGFEQFRSKLSQAVANKDRAAFEALLSPAVLVSFGGAIGIEEFEQQWDVAEPDVWAVLRKLLRGGCARSDSARIIPSLSTQLEPFGEEELVDRVLILPGAKLYESIGVESKDPRTEPWSVVPVIDRAFDLGTGVHLPDGREGFIADDELYEPGEYRLMIEQRDGKWMITAFIAGD